MNKQEALHRLNDDLAYYESEIQIRSDLIRTTMNQGSTYELQKKVDKYRDEKKDLIYQARKIQQMIDDMNKQK